jgi:ankyrin repeat protein
VINELITSEGIDINAENEDGQTAFASACLEGHEQAVRHLMQVEGVIIDIKDKHGKLPRQLALEKGYDSIVALFDNENGDPKSRKRKAEEELRKEP